MFWAWILDFCWEHDCGTCFLFSGLSYSMTISHERLKHVHTVKSKPGYKVIQKVCLHILWEVTVSHLHKQLHIECKHAYKNANLFGFLLWYSIERKEKKCKGQMRQFESLQRLFLLDNNTRKYTVVFLDIENIKSKKGKPNAGGSTSEGKKVEVESSSWLRD